MMKQRVMAGVRKIAPAMIYVIVSVIIFVSLSNYRDNSVDEKKRLLGEKAVLLLYDFGTPEQLNYQMRGLKAITTEPVFNQLTIDNEDRTLNTYLKFKNEAVTVNVIRSSSDYVMYSLSTPNISEERVFVFFFEVNDGGIIEYVREAEVIDFINSYR